MNEKVSSIINGTFEIDLTEVELRKGDTCIKGKGVIYQKNEELHLKLFNNNPIDEESKIEEFLTSLNQPNKTKILREDDYYILLGKDQEGNTYKSKAAVFYIATEIIAGKLYSDLIKEKADEWKPISNTLEIYINDNNSIPLNDRKNTRVLFGKSEIQYFETFEDAWFFNVSEKYKIQVQRNNRYQRILIRTECKIFEDEIDKLLDSLRFVFGRHFDWFYINYNFGSKEKFHLRRTSNVNTIFVPPLKINNNDNVEIYEKLFNCYYAYLSKSDETAKKLNFHVRKTNIAGYSYLGAFELVLATSIEGILNNIKPETNSKAVKDENIMNDVKKISKFLEENFTKENKVRSRVGGILNIILKNKISNAKDVLNFLIDNKKIGVEYKEIYELRNLFAHAVVPDNDTIVRISDLNKMIALFYHLVFLQIGYNGQHTNYFNDELENFTHTIK
jgi:hypothetical protein